MKIYIAFRFRDKNLAELEENLKNICFGLEKAGHTCLCTFWDEDHFQKNNFTKKQIIDHALKKVDKCDCLLAFIKSDEKSEGMLIEFGYAYAKNKKTIMAVKKGLKTSFAREMSDQVIEFTNFDELYEQIGKLKII